MDHILEEPWGFVSGENAQEATELFGFVEQTLAIYSELPGFSPEPLRMHYVGASFVQGSTWEGTSGITVRAENAPTWIALVRGLPDSELLCAHEMAHLYFSELHSYFPQVIEEGICELQAEMVTPAEKRFTSLVVLAAQSYLDDFTIRVKGLEGKRSLAMFVESVHSIEEALAITNDELLASSTRARAADYGLGWMIARLIGWEGLVELVRRAKFEGLEQVPLDRVLQAAGLFPLDQEHLRVAFMRSFGAPYPDASREIILTLGE
jgi:hypothetical protein